MTSNIGTRQVKDYGTGVGFNTGVDKKELSRSIIQKALNKAFAPEFINRIDDIIMFNDLDKDALFKIIDIELYGLFKRAENEGYHLSITDAAKSYILDNGYDKQFGARPLKRAIQEHIENNLAELILNNSAKPGSNIIIDYKEGDSDITLSFQH